MSTHPSISNDEAQTPAIRTLVLGLGNPILSDDAVGLRVARELQQRLATRPDVEVDVNYRGGLQLMERLVGYDRAILIDAMYTRETEAGTVRLLAPTDFPTRNGGSSHDLSLPEALALGRKIGARVPAPEHVKIVAIEAAEVEIFSEACTPKVERSIPRAVELVLAQLDEGRR